MKEGQLPNLAKLRAAGGFSRLGTSIPPQSPVAWANFINGAGPGSHGIFDFIHRHPHEQCAPFYSAAETLPGEGGWEVGDHRLQLDFWPFNHKPPATVLRRQGMPFWDYLDAAGVPSTFYDLPSNYPPSPSHHGHHRCICGMGTPDMLGTYGTYQYFAEDGPAEPLDEGGGKRSKLTFENETARAQIVGPDEQPAQDAAADRHRVPRPSRPRGERGGDRDPGPADRAQGRPVEPLDEARLRAVARPRFVPNQTRQRHLPVLPSGSRAELPALRHARSTWTPPPRRCRSRSRRRSSRTCRKQLGPFYTTGFQEDHKARTNGVFTDDEFLRQASMVLEERLALFEYAVDNYDDGLLFFYFSSSDLQSHMFWWNSRREAPDPVRPPRREVLRPRPAAVSEARRGGRRPHGPLRQPGDDHRDERPRLRQLRPAVQPQLLAARLRLPRPARMHVDHDTTSTGRRPRAYGLGINGLYLNLKGRERDGIVEPGEQARRAA